MFIDETGFRLQPVNRRTWSRRGQTPVQRAWDRRDRLSVIGAVVLSPARRRITTPFAIQETNVKAVDVVAFVKLLKRRLQRPLIVVWDRWNVHRLAEKQVAASRLTKISFEQLPAYAPELNPVEPRWSNTKYADLANFVPDDIRQLKRSVNSSLKKHAAASSLKKSLFKSARLKI
ncbi:MAG: transposase [Planctomycetales bacterium]|nr:transposase [Planctomycetales bacterium]